MSDNKLSEPPSPPADANEELQNTAAGWRSDVDDTEAADSAEKVARGAERAAEQPGYGREGS